MLFKSTSKQKTVQQSKRKGKPRITEVHRSTTDIIYDLLFEAIKFPDGISKTRLMFGASITSGQLSRFAHILLTNDLLEIRPATQQQLKRRPQISHYYTATRKAQIFIKLYSDMGASNILWTRKEKHIQNQLRQKLLELEQQKQREEEGQ